MKMRIFSFFIQLFSALLFFFFSSAQCLTAPVMPACTGTEPLLLNAETVNISTTKYFYGAPAIYGDLYMNGGTLIVCGDLTVDRFVMDSGTVFIQPGARFVIGGGIGYGVVLKGKCAFYNYGTLQSVRNISFDNGWASPSKPNIIINATPASEFKMSNQYFVINNANSWFVNKGKADFHGLITDPQCQPGVVCLGLASETKMTVLYNRVKNAYVAPEGSACLNVSEYSQIYDTLTRFPQINVCLGPTHRTDSTCMPFGCKPSWGLANKFHSCAACSVIQLLSAKFTTVSAVQTEKAHLIQWNLENFSPAGQIEIQQSRNGFEFQTILTRNMQDKFQYSTTKLFAGNNFYRIRYADKETGVSIFSSVVSISGGLPSGEIQIYPNPFVSDVMIEIPETTDIVTIEIVNPSGQVIRSQKTRSLDRKIKISIPQEWPDGIYLFVVKAGQESWTRKLVKK
ncbi:MAG: T9SS type A sorting domain-containing protein [Gemmatimonadaceae bacterium]|nr:T9SS type A sorting domain-containing protein [Chitinophagaceae bacterium]